MVVVVRQGRFHVGRCFLLLSLPLPVFLPMAFPRSFLVVPLSDLQLSLSSNESALQLSSAKRSEKERGTERKKSARL
jgi:hypothetical protein